MPSPIDRQRVQHLRTEGAQLVEVLPRAEYQRLDESGWDTCFVVDGRGVVFGRIGPKRHPK